MNSAHEELAIVVDKARVARTQDAWDLVTEVLQRCPYPECEKCAEIVCPTSNQLHFHHDGCPDCSFDEMSLGFS